MFIRCQSASPRSPAVVFESLVFHRVLGFPGLEPVAAGLCRKPSPPRVWLAFITPRKTCYTQLRK